MTGAPSGPPGDLPPLRDIIARYGLSARKSLGQNFLLDINLTRRIARAAGDLENCTVVEIGPGPGGLTRALLLEGAHVIAVERDERCLPALEELAAAFPGRLHIVHADALSADPLELARKFDPRGKPVKIVANLPYNVATPLLLKWLGHARDYESFTLMFQKEVADRLCAEPRSKNYGRLSVAVQWLCRVKPLFTIPGKAFTPPPKVDSTVVSLLPRDQPLAPADKDILEKVVKAAFGQRRKMLRSSLKSLTGRANEILETAGIEPTARAEELSVESFCALARAFEDISAP